MALIPRLMPNYLDGVFDDFFTPMKGDDFSKMKCDIYEKDGIYTMEMDIPGFNKEDVKIEVDDNDYLTITAEKTSESDSSDDGKNYEKKDLMVNIKEVFMLEILIKKISMLLLKMVF